MDASVDQVPVGQKVTYELTVVNHGPDDTASFTLVDTLPAEEEYADASPGASVSNNVVTITGGPLAVGASASFQIVAGVIASGSLANSATVTGASSDPATANNNAQYTVTAVGGAPLVTLAATVPSVIGNSGEIGQFTLTLSAVQTGDVEVAYTVNGSATNGADYELLKGTAKIKAGKTTKVIKVVPQGDLGGAAKKTVVLTLDAGTDYTVGTTGKVKVKILAPSN